MSCARCKDTECSCSREKLQLDMRWIVEQSIPYSVMRVHEYIDKHGCDNQNIFYKKYEAEEYRQTLIHENIIRAKRLLTESELLLNSPTTLERLKVYEGVFHSLQLKAEIAMNPEKTKELIRLICEWSYAHRVGNDELTKEEQQIRIDRAFKKLAEKS